MQFQDMGEAVRRGAARAMRPGEARGAPALKTMALGAVLVALATATALQPAAAAEGPAATSGAHSGSWAAVVTYVVDGDSVWVRSVQGRSRVKLRLLGIDAPEICQSQGAEARPALITLALNRPVQVTVRARDRYGRALATVERAEDGLDLSHAMVTGGWAWADRFRRQQAALEQDEGVARAQRRGVFRQSDAEPPADFRRRHGPCVAAKR